MAGEASRHQGVKDQGIEASGEHGIRINRRSGLLAERRHCQRDFARHGDGGGEWLRRETFTGYNSSNHGSGRINVFNSLALASGNLWTRPPNPGIADMTNAFKAAGAANGATVGFFYGTATGSTSVQGCSLSVDIANASSLGTATAGANGSAVKNIFVPGEWSTVTVYLQVVEYGNPCRKSSVVIYTFP